MFIFALRNKTARNTFRFSELFQFWGKETGNGNAYVVNALAIPEYANRHEKTIKKVAQAPMRTR